MDIVKPMRNQGFLLFGKAEIIIDMKVKKGTVKTVPFFFQLLSQSGQKTPESLTIASPPQVGQSVSVPSYSHLIPVCIFLK